MTEKNTTSIHVCHCRECGQHPKGETAKLHNGVNRVVAALDEKNRRRFVGLWASQLGRGGVQLMATVTGMSRTTILRGRSEIQQADSSSGGRIRATGGGRKPVEKNVRA